MTVYTKPVARALELLGVMDGDGSHRLSSRDTTADDCASWVVLQVKERLDRLAGTDRLDSESVKLALKEIKALEDETISELKLAMSGMVLEGLEREKWLPQRVAELEADLNGVDRASASIPLRNGKAIAGRRS